MPSIAQILALPALALEPLTIPDPDADARWVTASELPNPSQFLEGGEILLTTGLLERSADDWRLFVTRVLEAGVVAVGFGVGVSHPGVPPELSAAAADLSLNLFVVPRRVPFIAVSRAVADLLWSAEREADRLSLQHQRELTSAALGGPTALLDVLARTLGGSAVLCSVDGSVIAGYAPNELIERADPLIERMSRTPSRSASSDIVRGSRIAVHPVGVGSRADAFLVVEGDSVAGRVAVTTALALLALDRERARAERDADRRIRSGALSLALRADTEAARSLLAGSPHAITLPDSRARVIRSRGTAAELDDALTRIERSAPRSALLFAVAGDQLVGVVGPTDDDRASVLGLVGALESGIGPVRQLEALAQSDDGARLALAAATAARPVVDWVELVEAGIDSLVDAASLESFAAELLDGVLERSDAEELLETLRGFLTHNGQVGPAAAALGVHRNTLRNRLAAAESAIGRSLHDPQLRADLWVALKQRG